MKWYLGKMKAGFVAMNRKSKENVEDLRKSGGMVGDLKEVAETRQ